MQLKFSVALALLKEDGSLKIHQEISDNCKDANEALGKTINEKWKNFNGRPICGFSVICIDNYTDDHNA